VVREKRRRVEPWQTLEVGNQAPPGVDAGAAGGACFDVRQQRRNAKPLLAVDEEIEPGMVSLEGTIETRVYLGVSTQITVSLGNGARVVAFEQATYRSSPEDRWEPGTQVKLGWHPEHCLVLR